MNQETTRYWVSRTEPLEAEGGELPDPTDAFVQLFVRQLADILAESEDIDETAVMFDAKNHQLMLSGIVRANGTSKAIDAAQAAFTCAIEGAGGLDSTPDQARWFAELLHERAGTQTVAVALAA
jgi:hypothetical protein